MDERLEPLLDSYPLIFESRVPDIGDFEDNFVVITVPIRPDSKNEDAADAFDLAAPDEDDLLNDLHYWEPDQNSILDRPGLTVNPWLWLGDVYDGPYGDRLIARIRKRVRGIFPGSPGGRPLPLGAFAPPPDTLAFYLPFHRYPDYWGIYLIDAGVRAFSQALLMYLHGHGHKSFSLLEARTIAVAYLYHHEAYHSAVEGFALRAELPTRRAFYRTGLRKLLKRPWAPGSPHEETLATAYGLRKVRDNLKMPASKRDAALDALIDYLRYCPPEYADGINYVDDKAFVAHEQLFKERAVNETLGSRVVIAPEAWQLGTYLLMPLLQRNRKYSWICDRSDFRKKSRLAIHYFRRKDVVRCLARIASTREEVGGRHVHLVREVDESGAKRERRTQIPSGEIRDGTLSKMLKDLEVNLNVHAFRNQCRAAGHALS